YLSTCSLVNLFTCQLVYELPITIGFQLSVFGCPFSVVGFRLSVVSFLLFTTHHLLLTNHYSPFTDHPPLITHHHAPRCRSFVTSGNPPLSVFGLRVYRFTCV